MKGSRFSEEQIMRILRQHEAGATTAEVRRKPSDGTTVWNEPPLPLL